jgi:hypothetical protein
MFNEGVDLPNVDTVMMLRPTESRIMWLQQLGRGLRKAEGKPHLTVIDYIGNHRTFLLKPQTLFSLAGGDAAIARALDQLLAGDSLLPPGCEVTYDLRAVDILRALLRVRPDHEALRSWYEEFRERHGVRPRAVEAFHEGYSPRAARRSYGSWLSFVATMGDLDTVQASLLQDASAPGDRKRGGFLAELETTPMTRSFKMVVLQAMLNADRLPGMIEIDTLVRVVAQVAGRSAKLRADVGSALNDPLALRHHLEVNPLAAWTGGAGTGGTAYFSYADGRFSSRFLVPDESRPAFQELVRELVEWRLAEYLDRQPDEVEPVPGTGRIVCKVSHAAGRPILFLPDRSADLHIPRGEQSVTIDGQMYEARFAEVAVNVIRKVGSPENELPVLMREWFGPDAGLPGTDFRVAFEPEGEAYRLAPLRRMGGAAGAEIGQQYSREQIPRLFGLPFRAPVWQQGFVSLGDQVFLLVTLDKSGKSKAHQYQDRFLATDRFQWQSQNKQHRKGATEQRMARHVELGIPVHLFVRAQGKTDGRAARFVYCGECTFVGWEGDRPITVQWALKDAVPERWRGALGVPTSSPGR